MANNITKAERDQLNNRAAELLAEGIGPGGIVTRLMTEFSISRDRAKRATSKAIMARNRPGAPAGNDNAARKDGRPRVQLNIRVEQATKEWLLAQAPDGNIGRYLDEIART